MDSSGDTFKSATFEVSLQQISESLDIFESKKNDQSEEEEEEYRRKTRKRLTIIAVSTIILMVLIFSAIIGTLVPIHKHNNSSSSSNKDNDPIKKICNLTLYQDSCYSSIYSLKMSTGDNPGPDNPDTPREIFMLSLKVTLNELMRVKSSISKKLVPNDANVLKVCGHVIQDAIDHVNMSMSSNVDNFSSYLVNDLRTWLSTAITDQQTCLDGITEFDNIIPLSIQEQIKASMQNGTMFTSNSLAIISNMFQIIPGFLHEWNLIQRRIVEAEEVHLRPNVTVAKDGSGDYWTITEAVKAVPRRNNRRFFIYVKEGDYEENVMVDSDTWNLMIYGDGMNKSIVSSSLNYADGVATYDSGTFIAEGRGFIAKDMGFKNRAGPAKLQAVAVRSSSDQSIFYRCYFDAYQDTLYTHTNRQFYRNCLITGTIDFIFGNAAAVFQNCTIQPRQPGPGQYNTITAQSKSDPNQSTGISIQWCRITPFDNLKARTFLGRPWNNYSTTVIMETDIDGIIDPDGWIAWEPGTDAPDTIFYAEYNNTGPGTVLNHRVTWPGYRPDITEEEAEKFCVETFIQGSKWIIKANVEYDSHI